MKLKKRLGFALILALAIVVVSGSLAYANFGPHGGYEKDTDACAGCHRAHTSFATVGWTDAFGVDHDSALLVSSASTQEEFCLACHGDLAPGASTNVESGIFDAGPSASAADVAANANSVTDTPGTTSPLIYDTDSSFEATLNGGGFVRLPADSSGASFDAVSSLHDMDYGALTDPMWGIGQSADNYGTNLSCGGCHDPHGSSNYRLLKDTVNGNTVGGYDVNDQPDAFVVSREIGYPVATDGWLKHEAGAAQIASYTPNYTSEAYATRAPAGSTMRSMSGWCAACHESYINRTSDYDYTVTDGTSNVYTGTDSVSGNTVLLGEWYDADGSNTFNAGDTALGNQTRYRHAVNVPANGGWSDVSQGWLNVRPIVDDMIPLEMAPASVSSIDRYTWDDGGLISCLTCHRAHGTSAEMTGWAESSYMYDAAATVDWYPVLTPQGAAPGITSGVNPNFTSALLRADNRGVCERCHNK